MISKPTAFHLNITNYEKTISGINGQHCGNCVCVGFNIFVFTCVLAGLCFSSSQTACSSNTSVCGSSKFISDPFEIHDRGCIAEADCANTTGSVLNVNYTITRYCCNTDLCNGVASIHLPLTTALCAALVAVWSQWSL
uniref:UPAR/Ly6 domain-containing protein n=1 Tax=Anabas testudineus TaxID=64144 RepID=A0A7N6B5W9_ANATE